MFWEAYLPMVVLGCVLVGLGIIFLLWYKKEEADYMNELSQHQDMREFLTGWPERGWRGALAIGGWASMASGVILIILATLLFWKSG